MVKEANPLAQDNMGNAHMEFVEQTCFQGLLNRATTMKGHIFLASKLFCLLNCAFNALGDKMKLGIALFH